MSNRHAHRNERGQFVPVPEADTDVVAPSGDPQDEHARPNGTVYLAREFTHPDGSYSPLRGRRAVVIDAQTGQALSDRIVDVRAIETRPGGRTHVVQVGGQPFEDEVQPPDTMRHHRDPGRVRRLPSKGQTDDPPVPTETGIDNSRGLFR